MTNQIPKVSVIVPNYNHAKFLERRISSILNQTYQNFELIILDDCSTDDSKQVIYKYKDHPKVSKICFNEHNSGSPFKQWSKGLGFASGEWIWIAESDDNADSSFLEKLIKKAKGDPSSGLIYSDSIAIDNKGEIIEGYVFSKLKNISMKTDHWASDYHNLGLAELEDYMLLGGTVNNTSAALFKRTVFNNANVFDNVFRYIGDKYAFVKVLSISNISYVNEPLNYYRVDIHDIGLHKNALRYCYEHFVIFNWVIRNNIPVNKKKLYKAFYHNLKISFYKKWSGEKIKVFTSMARLNPLLFCRFMLFNLINPLITRL